jgi:CHASE2 domain-containing sensor protein
MRHRIYLPLLDKPSELRPTEAEVAGEGMFKIVGRPVLGEQWRFNRGEVVECASQMLEAGVSALVAVRSCSRDPEYRKRRMTFAILGTVFGAFVGGVIPLLLGWSPPIALLGAVIGATVVGMLSVRWRDAAWRNWGWLEASWWQ